MVPQHGVIDRACLLALGLLLGSARRTLLLLPAAEALEASISRAEEAAGLPLTICVEQVAASDSRCLDLYCEYAVKQRPDLAKGGACPYKSQIRLKSL